MTSKVVLGTSILAWGVLAASLASAAPAVTGATEAATSSRIETFTFSSNGMEVEGKISLPDTYDEDANLPAIFLIDYAEQDFRMATDEFEKVIEGVRQVQGLDALVVTLEDIPDVDAEPETFQEHYGLFRSMTAFVDGKYTNNPSRTFVGKGSESGVVLMALLLEEAEAAVFDNFIATDPSSMYSSAIIEMLENETFPTNKENKKLHFSFSTSNDRALCTRLIDLFDGAQYPWLTFEATEYTDSDYENTYPISYAAGIRFVFSN
jgi:hypothetical protein